MASLVHKLNGWGSRNGTGRGMASLVHKLNGWGSGSGSGMASLVHE